MPLDPTPYAGPLIVTLVYLLLYYVFMTQVARVKGAVAKEWKDRGEKFDRYRSGDPKMLAADRIQLNVLEHMPPFLVLLWLNAVFVGTTSATIAGAVYVAARVSYPFMMGPKLGRGIKAKVMIATVPGYLVIAWYVGALVWALLGGA